MNDHNLLDITTMHAFLNCTDSIEFEPVSKQERYAFIEQTLSRLRYHVVSRKDKGVIIRYLMKLTTYSRQQLTRLIHQHRRTGKVRRCVVRKVRSGFQRRYTAQDIARLVKTDEAHDTLSGPATKKLFERAYHVYGGAEYECLANISVAHIYNLRKSAGYLRNRRHFTKTQKSPVDIGERRKPQPNQQPGFLRIDTVHQGDQDGQKGVYHINAVDEVTQYQVVVAVEHINEACMIPALAIILAAFPFKIINCHCDNGSEYINYKVAKLLNNLLIKLTKSRARQSNDNALVESKNGAIIRKYLGYGYIKQNCAELINQFYEKYLIPYLNYHRPCFYPEEKALGNGKIKKIYPYKNMMTPYDKLCALPNAERYLKPHISFEELNICAMRQSDLQAAQALKSAQTELFKSIGQRERGLS